MVRGAAVVLARRLRAAREVQVMTMVRLMNLIRGRAQLKLVNRHQNLKERRYTRTSPMMKLMQMSSMRRLNMIHLQAIKLLHSRSLKVCPTPYDYAITNKFKDGSKVEAQTPDGTRIAMPGSPPSKGAGTQPARGTQTTKTSYAAALKAKPTDWHLEFSMDDHELP